MTEKKKKRATRKKAVNASFPELTQQQNEHAAMILAAISNGASLRKATATIGIAAGTFLLWTNKDARLKEQYAHACEERGLALAEEALEVSDNSDLDPNHKRIMVDTRKWFASKLNPKRLGDARQMIVSGPEGGPVRTDSKVELVFVKPEKG